MLQTKLNEDLFGKSKSQRQRYIDIEQLLLYTHNCKQRLNKMQLTFISWLLPLWIQLKYKQIFLLWITSTICICGTIYIYDIVPITMLSTNINHFRIQLNKTVFHTFLHTIYSFKPGLHEKHIWYNSSGIAWVFGPHLPLSLLSLLSSQLLELLEELLLLHELLQIKHTEL